jgi:hypothetical protein
MSLLFRSEHEGECQCKKCEGLGGQTAFSRLTAVEAKHITKKAQTVNMDSIYERIRMAASKGESCVVVPISGVVLKFISGVIDKLKEDGFMAEHKSEFDQKESETYNELIIEW